MKVESSVAQSCLTLCNPMDCSLPGSSVHRILQVRILEWVAISFSRGSSQPRDQTRVSHIVGRCFTIWATREISILEWAAFPFSRGSSQPRDRTQVSRFAGRFFTSWATQEGLKSRTCYFWYIWTFSMLFCFFVYHFSLYFPISLSLWMHRVFFITLLFKDTLVWILFVFINY